jgi:indole-3-glycerol phosphate synthase
MFDYKTLQTIKSTVDSGYYERLTPIRREGLSICDAIEQSKTSGRLPIITEISTTWPQKGSLLPNRNASNKLIDKLSICGICAVSVWVEPKFYAGNLRWLSKKLPIPIIVKDLIIDKRQIIGGDAVVLNLSLLSLADSDPNDLIDFAHDLGMEAILELNSENQMDEAKSTEADLFLVNNNGPNGTGPDLSVTKSIFEKNGTGRQVISSHGIYSTEDVHSVIIAGADAIELSAIQTASPGIYDQIKRFSRALHGKDPKVLL